MRVIVLASSTGGPAALVRVLSRLRLDSRASVILVQHMQIGFTEALAAQLTSSTPEQRYLNRQARRLAQAGPTEGAQASRR